MGRRTAKGTGGEVATWVLVLNLLLLPFAVGIAFLPCASIATLRALLRPRIGPPALELWGGRGHGPP